MRKTQHSVKVPQLYKAASKITKTIKGEGGSLKDLVFSYNHLNIKGLYALVLKAFQYEDTIERIIKNTKILIKEERADPWLVKILVTELLFGRKYLSGDSKPVQTVLSYQVKLQKELEIIEKKGLIQPDSTRTRGSTLRYVRVNTLHLTVEEALKYFHDDGWKQVHHESAADYGTFLKNVTSLAEDEFTQDFHINELLVFPHKTEFFNHELYLNGSIILQDKASCLASWLLCPPPGSVTLDMCAAPGMKTTHLAALMQNKGVVHAVEMNEKRHQVLKQQVEKCGATCVKTLHKDALCLDASQCPDVQYILVDPSCSGSGMVGRLTTENEEKHNASRLEKLAGFQILLLRHALTKFPDVKRVVYSTCSLNIEENEQVVDRVLTYVNGDESNPAFRIVDGLPTDKWPHRGSADYECGHRCLYAQPDTDFTNGFFVAVFERLDSSLDKESPTSFSSDKKRKRKKRKKSVQGHTNEEDDIESKTNSDISKNVTSCLLVENTEDVDILNESQNDDRKEQVLTKKKRKKRKFKETKDQDAEMNTGENMNQEKGIVKSGHDVHGNYKTKNHEDKLETTEENNDSNINIKEKHSEGGKVKKKKKRRKNDQTSSEQNMEYERDNKVPMKDDYNILDSGIRGNCETTPHEEKDCNVNIKEKDNEGGKVKKKKKNRRKNDQTSSEQNMEYELDEVPVKEDYNKVHSSKESEESSWSKGHKKKKMKNDDDKQNVSKCFKEDNSMKRKQEDCDEPAFSKKQGNGNMNDSAKQMRKGDNDKIKSKKKKKHKKSDITESIKL